VLTLAALVVYGLCYVLFPLVGPPVARWVPFTFCVGMVVLGLALVGLHGVNSYVIIYAVAAVVFLLPAAWALIIVGSALLLILIALLASGQLSAGIGDLISVSSIAITLVVVSRLLYAVRALQRANEEIATLAVTSERQRMARDLHDILGHSLTTIAVKAGWPGGCWKARTTPTGRSSRSTKWRGSRAGRCPMYGRPCRSTGKSPCRRNSSVRAPR
jgi:two-component system sensor histidine kinase DesK